MTRFINIILVLSLATTLSSMALSPGAPTSRQGQSRPAAEAALRQGGLKAAAAASGGEYTSRTEWLTDIAYTLPSLAAEADVVLIGTLGEGVGHLSASGEYITTDFRMTVEKSLKGKLLPHSTVVFQVMGGKVVFEDSSSATIETKGFIRPNAGARVVIFGKRFPDGDRLMTPVIRAYANGAPVFRLVGMGRGVYELPDDDNDKIKMNAIGATDAHARRLRGLNRGQFIAELEQAVRGPGEPRK